VGAILGTPAFMAPEQAQGSKVDARADLFSLGVVLYRLCTGELPFRGPDTLSTLMALITTEPPPPRALQADIPQELSDLVMHLLAKDPARRPASAQEVVQAISKIEKDLKTSGGYPAAIPVLVSLPVPVSAPAGRKRKRWLLAGSAVLLLGTLGYFLAGFLGRGGGDQGTLIVEVDDPKVKVLIRQQDAVVRNRTTAREFTLRGGPGVVEVFDADGVGPLRATQFTLERGGKATVKVRMNSARFGRPKLTPDPGGHWHLICKVRFTPDGKYLLSGAGDGLRIWDVATGKTVRVLHPPGHFMGHFALAADGRKLAVVCRYPGDAKPTHVVYVMTFPEGRIKHVLKGHAELVRSAAFSADGRRLASGGDDKTICIWDLDRGQPVQVLPTAGPVIGLAFAPDGKRLAEVGSDSYFCTIMAVPSGKTVARLNAGKVNAWTSQDPVAWSPDGTTVATCGPDGFRLWKPEGTLQRHLLAKVPTGSVAFSTDSRRVLAAWRFGDHRAAVFDVGSGSQGATFLPKRFVRPPKNSNGGVLSPDGKLAATAAGADGIREIFLWNTANGALVRRLAAPIWLPWPESQASWSADGKIVSWRPIATPGSPKGPRTRPPQRRRPINPKGANAGARKGGPTTFHLGELHLSPPLAAAQVHGTVVQRGSLFLKRVNSKTVQVLKNGEIISDLTLPKRHQLRDPFTLVGQHRAALNSGSSLVFVFDTDTGKLLRDLWHAGIVWSIAPSPNGRYVLSLGEDQILRIFDPNREQALLLQLYVSGQEWVLWTPEGYYAASPGGERLMGWTVHQGIDKEANFYPAAHFRKQFYRPDVIRRVLEKGSVEEALAAANAALKKG
jgi:WD40 repeat protein